MKKEIFTSALSIMLFALSLPTEAQAKKVPLIGFVTSGGPAAALDVARPPRLLDANPRNVEQMRLVNALSRFVEFTSGYSAAWT